MKKVMIAAAAVTLAAAVQAGIVVNTNCHPRSATCPVVAFKVTANGKIAAPAETKAGDIYTTATKLQIKKGALILFPTDLGDGDCCYEPYSLYLQVKVGKYGTFPVGVFYENIDSWSIFGKSYGKAVEAEKTKKYSVESELGLSYANAGNFGTGAGLQSQNAGNDSLTGALGLPIDDALADFAFIATAFGKGTYKYSYKVNNKACSVCSVDEGYEFVPGSYSGWFAGLVSNLGGDYGCLLCACAELDVFGGTWKAKYDKTWSKNSEGWQKAAAYVFGAGTLASMIENEIE
jgi:hypothetical protein